MVLSLALHECIIRVAFVDLQIARIVVRNSMYSNSYDHNL